MYVCLCKGLTEMDVQTLVQNGRPEPQALIKALRLDDEDCCGRCARNIDELLTVACGTTPCGLRLQGNLRNHPPDSSRSFEVKQ